MPELPEVETVRRQLLPLLRGQTLSGVEVFHTKSVDHNPYIEDTLLGKTIDNIERVGKLLIFSFQDETDIFLLAHLKMTGQFFYTQADGTLQGGGHKVAKRDIEDLPNRHTRVAFYFNDMRLFGYIKLANTEMVAQAKAGFGPEPISEDFDHSYYAKRLRKRSTPVKAALLDQSFIAGLGNIYVDEALFRAGIRPTKKASLISQKKAEELLQHSGEVMQEAIAVGGTTFQHFLDAEGNTGNFTEHLQVFGRNGLPCLKCGTIIKKTRVAGRGTHYCPTCQK